MADGRGPRPAASTSTAGRVTHRRGRPHHRRRGVPGAARALGMREDHPAAHDRRPGGADRGRCPHRRQRRHRAAAAGPADRDGVPELRPLPAQDGAGQHRLPAARGPACRPGQRERKARWAAGTAGHRAPARPPASPALRRRAPACRAGPRAGARAARVPARRAAVQPRRQAAGDCARRAQAIPAGRRHDDDLRDARPDRGDGARRPDRGDDRRAGSPGRAAGRGLRRARRHVRRHLHRLAADEPRAARGVLVGFRPEHLLAGGERRAATGSHCALDVQRVEYLSGDRHVYGTVTAR